MSHDKPNLRQTLLRRAQQLWAIPQLVAAGARQRRERKVLAGLELERLDRIRNPSKYLGK